MLQCPDVIMTLACDLSDMFIKTQSRIQRHPEQLNRVRELGVSTSDVDSLGLVELRQPLARIPKKTASVFAGLSSRAFSVNHRETSRAQSSMVDKSQDLFGVGVSDIVSVLMITDVVLRYDVANRRYIHSKQNRAEHRALWHPR